MHSLGSCFEQEHRPGQMDDWKLASSSTLEDNQTAATGGCSASGKMAVQTQGLVGRSPDLQQEQRSSVARSLQQLTMAGPLTAPTCTSWQIC